MSAMRRIVERLAGKRGAGGVKGKRGAPPVVRFTGYLDERDKMSVTDFLKQAFYRIDGIAMYLVCAFFILFGFYSLLASQFGWPLLKRWEPWKSLLFSPVVFLYYVWFDTFVTPGKVTHLVNACIIFCIPIMVAYKLKLI